MIARKSDLFTGLSSNRQDAYKGYSNSIIAPKTSHGGRRSISKHVHSPSSSIVPKSKGSRRKIDVGPLNLASMQRQ
jgi:hypothetical protein